MGVAPFEWKCSNLYRLIFRIVAPSNIRLHKQDIHTHALMRTVTYTHTERETEVMTVGKIC